MTRKRAAEIVEVVTLWVVDFTLALFVITTTLSSLQILAATPEATLKDIRNVVVLLIIRIFLKKKK